MIIIMHDYYNEFRNGDEQFDQMKNMYLVWSTFSFQGVVIQKLNRKKNKKREKKSMMSNFIIVSMFSKSSN